MRSFVINGAWLVGVAALVGFSVWSVCEGARVHGARLDRTVSSAAPARIAAWLVARPPARPMDPPPNQPGDVEPLAFLGPFAKPGDAQQLFAAMHASRGVATGVVCLLDWDAIGTVCESDDSRALADALGVQLCGLGAPVGDLPACGASRGGELLLLSSRGAPVVVEQRGRDCAVRACQSQGW